MGTSAYTEGMTKREVETLAADIEMRARDNARTYTGGIDDPAFLPAVRDSIDSICQSLTCPRESRDYCPRALSESETARVRAAALKLV